MISAPSGKFQSLVEGDVSEKLGTHVWLGAPSVTIAECLWPRGSKWGDSAPNPPSTPGILSTHCFPIKGHLYTEDQAKAGPPDCISHSLERAPQSQSESEQGTVGACFPGDNFFPRKLNA